MGAIHRREREKKREASLAAPVESYKERDARRSKEQRVKHIRVAQKADAFILHYWAERHVKGRFGYEREQTKAKHVFYNAARMLASLRYHVSVDRKRYAADKPKISRRLVREHRANVVDQHARRRNQF
jgi:hypothetical protein